MSDESRTRRDFIKAASAAAVGAAIASAQAAEPKAEPPKADTSKILNYNPKMGYRRLGKTGIMISEVSLGGHSGGDVENRAQVLARAAELGLNYLDTNIVGENELYGRALRGNRNRWHIGFASWPEKLTTDNEKNLSKEGMAREIDGRLRHYQTDVLDIWRPVGATWGPGQNSVPTLLTISNRVLDMVAEVFEKAHQEGKVRWLGVSAHNPNVFRNILEHYPQFSVVIFPYLFLTKELGGESLLELARQKDVGVIGLKPFGAGAVFGLRPSELKGALDTNAHVLVRRMLQEPRLSAIIPGVNTTGQLEENVRGSYERDQPLAPKEQGLLQQYERTFRAHRPPEYDWLRHWETI